MDVLIAGFIAVSANLASSRNEKCFQIDICACKKDECRVFPTTCIPKGWKIEDFTRCENKPDKIKIPMH
jgi:hypothetical protein